MQPAEPFIFNRRNVNYVHGKKKRLSSFQLGIGSFWRIFVFGLAVPIFGIVALYVLVGIDLITQIRVDQDYRTTRAEITDGISSTQDMIFTTYTIEYTFDIASAAYGDKQYVGGELWENSHLGDRVSVRYSALDPSLSYIEGETVFSTGRLPMTGVVVGFGALMLFGGISFWGKELRIRRLSRVGTILTGTLAGAGWSSLGTRTVVTYEAYVEFMTPEGEQVKSRCSITDRVTFPRRPVPLPGTPVLILYENKRRFMLL